MRHQHPLTPVVGPGGHGRWWRCERCQNLFSEPNPTELGTAPCHPVTDSVPTANISLDVLEPMAGVDRASIAAGVWMIAALIAIANDYDLTALLLLVVSVIWTTITLIRLIELARKSSD